LDEHIRLLLSRTTLLSLCVQLAPT
jgi:hypothetical protein